jgi:hypothetical protein
VVPPTARLEGVDGEVEIAVLLPEADELGTDVFVFVFRHLGRRLGFARIGPADRATRGRRNGVAGQGDTLGESRNHTEEISGTEDRSSRREMGLVTTAIATPSNVSLTV